MKVKIKTVYKNKVEPTSLMEVDSSEGSSTLENFVSTVENCLFKILDEKEDLQGIYISSEK